MVLTQADLDEIKAVVRDMIQDELADLVEALAVLEQQQKEIVRLVSCTSSTRAVAVRVAGQSEMIAQRAERPDSAEQRVLHRIAAAAGMPEPGDGCREVIGW
jgi:hypothetical protein